MSDEIGGRIFFSNTGRTFGEEDELCVLSVGVDIGSSTSHLVFSRIVLERLDSRYVVTERESFYQSDILLTPYAAEDTIDADGARRLHRAAIQGRQGRPRRDRYRRADPHRRRGAAAQCTGASANCSRARPASMVAVSAGDSLEIGDGGLWLGRGGALDPRRRAGDECRCRRRHGENRGLRRRQSRSTSPRSMSARGSSCSTRQRRIVRLEEAGRRFGAELGLKLEPGVLLAEQDARALAACMADRLFEAMRGGSPRARRHRSVAARSAALGAATFPT